MKNIELLDFSKFKEKKILEAQEELETKALYEAWSSNIMGMIHLADKNSDRSWFHSFVKDFNKIYNLSIDKIKDEDFTEIPIDAFFKPPYSKNRDILAVFINDDKALESEAKADLKKIDDKIKDLKKSGADKKEIEDWKRQRDKIKEIKVPIITAIAAGDRVLYAGFNYDDKNKTIQKSERYGILSSTHMAKRYYGENSNIKVTGANVGVKSTKAYIVNVADLKAKYDLGSTIDDRKEAKKDNPFFMSMEEIRQENMKRYSLLLHNKIDPKSILNMYKAMTETYTKNYLASIKVLGEKDFEAFLNDKIKLGENDLPAAGVFSVLDRHLRDYFKSYISYAAFLKESEKIAERVQNKKSSKQEFDAEEQKYNDQNDGLIEALVGHKETARKLYADLQKGNIEFTKKDTKLLSK